MAFWTCTACTCVNQGASDKCEMCGQTRKKPTSSSSSLRAASSLTLSSSQQEDISKWGCRACSFLNHDGQKVCAICATPRSSISLDIFAEIDSTLDEDVEDEVDKGTKFWPLRSCTTSLSQSQALSEEHETPSEKHSNMSSGLVSTCSMASRKRKQPESSESPVVRDSDCGSPITVSSAAALGKQKIQRKQPLKEDIISPPSMPSVQPLASNSSSAGDESIAILTYNVWFKEDLELVARMNAIGAIICEHTPHFICFQEITPAIYDIFQCASWWGQYKCSLSRMDSTAFYRHAYNNTSMGRELCIAEVVMPGGKQLFVATTHLESPCPAPPTWDQMFSSERVTQAKEALNALKGYQNVVFGGDMNWDDKLDGSPPLPPDWYDAWLTLRHHEEGLTYDSKGNPMLSGSRLRKRLDRFFCHLEDFCLDGITRVGTKPIAGVTFEKEMKVKNQTQKVKLPVLPSDHFGLLLKIRPSSVESLPD